jgi:hypothetical protein
MAPPSTDITIQFVPGQASPSWEPNPFPGNGRKTFGKS